MSVLVVEDDGILSKNIARSLGQAGYEVRTAASTHEACNLLAGTRPEAVCLDLHLPDGHGLDLLEETGLREDETPVIVMTGVGTDAEIERARSLGVDDILAKPFSLGDLRALVDRNVKRNGNDAPRRSGGPSSDIAAIAPAGIAVEPVAPERLAGAKKAFATRRVPVEAATNLITAGRAPAVGDLVLVRVASLGQHQRIELENGRRARLFVGDEIILSYGNRFAPDQFEAEVPDRLGDCHMVAAGGIAAKCLSKSHKVRKPTAVEVVGLLADHRGRPLNLSRWSLARKAPPKRRPHVIALLGTSMNAGKTTTVANLVFGFVRKGLRVGAAKVTGTGAGGDVWFMTDAGAHTVFDFGDCGVPSTYKLPIAEVESIAATLVAHLAETDADIIVLEIADGVYQTETRGLVTSDTFRRIVDTVVFAASDAAGAVAGVGWLKSVGWRVAAVSGALTASPLAEREAGKETGLAVLDLKTLRSGDWVPAEDRSVIRFPSPPATGSRDPDRNRDAVGAA